MQTNVTMPNFAKMVGTLKALNKDMDKAISRTISDCTQRAPAQVTKAVTAVYGIKSSEVTEAGKGAKRGAKTAGSIKVKGVSVDNVQLVYKGRLLTPIHFSMTPKEPPGKGKKYKVRAGVFKGQKKVLHPQAFVASVKKEYNPDEEVKYIAFKRKSKKSLPLEAIRTVSIPQMITSERVSADIKARMDELLVKRLNHNTDRLASKK